MNNHKIQGWVVTTHPLVANVTKKLGSRRVNRKFTTRFPMSLRWWLYHMPLTPQTEFKNAKRPISV